MSEVEKIYQILKKEGIEDTLAMKLAAQIMEELKPAPPTNLGSGGGGGGRPKSFGDSFTQFLINNDD